MIRADGAARGNPGPASAGAVIIDASQPGADVPGARPVAVIARPLGIQTNNYAEYTAVELALARARELGATEVDLVLDSKLVVEQLTGRWKVRHPAIRPLVDRIQALLAGFERWSVRHEPRASNHAADTLANLALDDPAAAARAESGAATAAPDLGPGLIGQFVAGAACVIFDAQGRVLLVRHSYGRHNWELPGGVVQPGESPAAAGERELGEETALRLSAGALTGVYFEAGHDFGPMLHFVFRFEPAAGETPTAQPPEIDDVGWFALDDLPSPISDFTERRIHDALAGTASYGTVERRSWR